MFNIVVDMDVQTFVTQALPNLKEEVKIKFMTRLIDLGVEELSDFNVLVASDFEPSLTVVQSRKLMLAYRSYCETPDSPSPSSRNTDNNLTSPCEPLRRSPPVSARLQDIQSVPKIQSSPHLHSNWAYNFRIPCERMSDNVNALLAAGKRLNPRLHRDFVCTISGEIMKFSKKPGRKNLRVIADKIVSMYPSSLKDALGSDTVFTGSYSLMKKLESRMDNVVRTLHVQSEVYAACEEEVEVRNHRRTGEGSSRPRLGVVKSRPRMGDVGILPELEADISLPWMGEGSNPPISPKLEDVGSQPWKVEVNSPPRLAIPPRLTSTPRLALTKRFLRMYGCQNAFPNERKEGENRDTEIKKKEEMQRWWKSGQWENSAVELFMGATYYAQRMRINSRNFTTCEILEEWPFLFQTDGLKVHYNELLGVSYDNIGDSLDKKGHKIIRYMKSLKTATHTAVQTILLDMEMAKLDAEKIDSYQIFVVGIILLLAAYFKEDIGHIFHIKEV